MIAANAAPWRRRDEIDRHGRLTPRPAAAQPVDCGLQREPEEQAEDDEDEQPAKLLQHPEQREQEQDGNDCHRCCLAHPPRELGAAPRRRFGRAVAAHGGTPGVLRECGGPARVATRRSRLVSSGGG